jgi:hypothetical protein
MVGAEALLADSERTLVEWFGLRVGSDGSIQFGEIVD